MNMGIFLSLGKEVSEIVKSAFVSEFKKHQFDVNEGRPNGEDKVALKIHQSVPDVSKFEDNVKSLLNHIPFLYLIAPSASMERLKHHPRIQCFDTSFIDDPDTAASVLLKYAYHGRPL